MDSPLGGGSLGESGDARMACPPSPAPLSASLHTEEGARAPVAPRPTVQPSLTSDEPQKTGALTPDLRAAPSPHKTAAAAPFYDVFYDPPTSRVHFTRTPHNFPRSPDRRTQRARPLRPGCPPAGRPAAGPGPRAPPR